MRLRDSDERRASLHGSRSVRRRGMLENTGISLCSRSKRGKLRARRSSRFSRLLDSYRVPSRKGDRSNILSEQIYKYGWLKQTIWAQHRWMKWNNGCKRDRFDKLRCKIGAKCAAQPFPANAQLLWLAAANAGSHYGYFEFPFPLK